MKLVFLVMILICLNGFLQPKKDCDEDSEWKTPISDIVRHYMDARYFGTKNSKDPTTSKKYGVSKDSNDDLRLWRMAISTEKPSIGPSNTNIIVLPLLNVVGESKDAANLLKSLGVGDAPTLYANKKLDVNFKKSKLVPLLSLFSYQPETEVDSDVNDEPPVEPPKWRTAEIREPTPKLLCRCKVPKEKPNFRTLSECTCEIPAKPKLRTVVIESQPEPPQEAPMRCRCKVPTEKPSFRTFSECECETPAKPQMKTLAIDSQPEKPMSCKCYSPTETNFRSSSICECEDISNPKNKIKKEIDPIIEQRNNQLPIWRQSSPSLQLRANADENDNEAIRDSDENDKESTEMLKVVLYIKNYKHQVTFVKAMDLCSERGMVLPIIRSQNHLDDLRGELCDDRTYWIGLIKPECWSEPCPYQWIDGISDKTFLQQVVSEDQLKDKSGPEEFCTINLATENQRTNFFTEAKKVTMGETDVVKNTVAILLSLLWISQFHTVSATIGRYGGAFRRPAFSPPARPNNPYQGQVVPSPTHAYSIFAKPPLSFKPQPQQYQIQPQQYQTQPQQYQTQPQPYQIQPQQYQTQPQYQQPIRYQSVHSSVQSPNAVRFPQIQQVAASQPVPQYYVQSPVQYYPQTQSRPLVDSPSATYFSYQTPNSYAQNYYRPPTGHHYHVSSSPTKTVAYDSVSSGSNQSPSYEGCTSSHWQPLQNGLGTQSIVTAPSSPSASIAMAPSSSVPTYFYGASVSPSTSNSNFRAVPNQQSPLSNKVVVLSHDVLKTLLTNGSKTSSPTKPVADSVGSASSTSQVVVSSHPSGAVTIVDQPSVKLVGYIGPAKESTPSGYLQIPINKQLMEGLGGSQTSYDFALNSTNYSLFTLKSVNDVQTILGTLKGGDSETSASSTSSQTIPLGLVISNEPKSNSAASETLFYPAAASSPVASVATTSGEPVSNPSIQMVGHVQITSPDVSAHFVKRQDAAVVAAEEPLMTA
ncbi:hypothetical protein CHUAL_011691 [Chamberlinius hualienensis]